MPSMPPDTFTLEVTISGLCLLQPRSTKLHVLMAASTTAHGGHGVERHYPRVFYDAAYDSADPNVLPIGRAYSAVSLEDRVLDLATPQAPGGTVHDLPDLVVNLDPFAPHPLPDPEKEPVPNLAARVTLPPGTANCPNPQGAWELKHQGFTKVLDRVAWHVVWTIEGMDGNSLSWRLDGLNGFPGQPLRPLYAKAGFIKLLISHVPLAESKPGPLHQGIPPAEGTPMPHFMAFRDLYDWKGAWPDMLFIGPRQPVNSTAYNCVPSGGH
jgi:hypothetical protein